jgi:hypothetical protein
MKRLKGTVKNNVVVLEEGVHLPDGTEVDVVLPARRRKLKEAIQRILDNPITRPVGIDEIIEENKRELDERDWFGEPSEP